ncbi:uncharacterized protein RJT21DRAFT_6255 [Scheffersomyces amazonensis]|uniref:uncharacterized protein n=1 Tax=Scheffersomyces amazonensis TaxID=1078765 RepID=UPI00315DC048
MSAQLIFRASELMNIETSWTIVERKSNFQIDSFVANLFTHMIASNRKLRASFSDDSMLKYHISVFGDMLNFVVTYANEPQTLNEFMFQFTVENERFCNEALTYLEDMGPALIATIKLYLPNISFEVESAWVKLYIFIGNCLLQYTESDKEEGSQAEPEAEPETESEPEEENIAPLNIKRPQNYEIQEPQIVIQKPQPRTSKPNTILDPTSSIQFHLNSNEKYKGFRRSVEFQTPDAEPISVKLPQHIPKFQKPATAASSNMSSALRSMLSSANSTPFVTPPSTPFDPRKVRRSAATSSASSINEEIHIDEPKFEQSPEPIKQQIRTPTKPSVNKKLPEIPSLVAKLEKQRQMAALSSSDEEEEVEIKPLEKFDPRSKNGHRRSHSISISSPESSEVDENEEAEIMRKHLGGARDRVESYSPTNAEPQISIPERSLSRGGLTGGTFDYNSFGLKGLAPIVETDDDNASSKYGDDDNNSSHYGDESNKSVTDEDSSSRSSSLSLHNSDYKSSISSGTESANNSPFVNKFKMNNSRTTASAAPRQSSVSSTESKNSFTTNQQTLPAQIYNRSYCSSTPSLLMGRNGDHYSNRASLGFMRSSFVLKKEMETLGYNEPENVVIKPTTKTIAMSSTANFGEQYKYRASTTTSLPRNFDSPYNFGTRFNDDDSFDLINSFHSGQQVASKATKREGLNYTSRVIEPVKEKKSFKQRMSSLFSSKSSTSSISTTNSVMSDSSLKTSSTRSSSVASVSNPPVRKVSSIQPKKSSVSLYSANSTMSRPSVVSDAASINSVETKSSSISGFSIFRKKKEEPHYYVHGLKSKKGAKYQVKAIPYNLELVRKGHNI